MQVTELLDELGYSDSPNFLPCDDERFSRALDYGHVFRQAAAKECHLRGVYVLGDQPDRATTAIVPLVYVCEASSEAEANEIHRRVWNQDVVPFLFVNTRDCVRLYSGFRYRDSSQDAERGVLRVLSAFNQVSEVVEAFHADSIDSGNLWRRWGDRVTPEHRVDWRLLRSLRGLDQWLREEGGLERRISHALIGKYVYLHYLRDRGILSRKKLAGWGLDRREIFGRDATLKGFHEVVRRLEDWLNGKIFPLPSGGSSAPKREHLRRVAGTFAGDEVTEDGSWQLHLDFQAYSFSYIPIETLSVVYEQFLHTPDEAGGKSRARESGAYYTPIPLVNFMLSELEARRPLKQGMRVFDPACGSGAFLVQCYRRMIEKEFPPAAGASPRPAELRKLLTRHIFGVDVDSDACSVTELSLILTLLDYVHPPDLENRPQFQLPELRGRNIFCDNFFKGAWQQELERKKAHWIVGNPPWKKIDPNNLSEADGPVWLWIQENRAEMPVADNQAARAFAWEASRYLSPDGIAGLLLPAKSLFDDRAQAFRSKFLQEFKLDAVASFANLRRVLFRGRSLAPPAAFFFRTRSDEVGVPTTNEAVQVLSPFLANQEATWNTVRHGKREAWSLVCNASELRELPLARIAGGSALPWKLAAWGSHLDMRLLQRLERAYPTLGDFEKDGVLVVCEGPQLHRRSVRKGTNKNEYCEELRNRQRLDVRRLGQYGKLFAFPEQAIVQNDAFYLRVRGGRRGLEVCRAPHVIVSAARTFAVYSDEAILVPPRQVGIASTRDDATFLEALSLFLSSDFAYYHQFLVSAELGVERDRSTPSALRRIPVPLATLTRSDLEEWGRLRRELVEASREQGNDLPLFPKSPPERTFDSLLRESNQLVSRTLGLRAREESLVRDLLGIRLGLNDGGLGAASVGPPSVKVIRQYAKRVKRQLDGFIGDELRKRHQVQVEYDHLSGMVAVDLTPNLDVARTITVVEANEAAAAELEKTRRRLRTERAQWVYFDRNWRSFEGTRTFIFKPMQRFHWTESQAMFDAAEIIAETLAGAGDVR
jgi:hypothetical protein